MKREKFIHNKDKAIRNNVRFCTECGEDLNNFGLPGEEVDIAKVQAHYKVCQEKGKFKGDICSKMFISNLSEPISLKDDTE
ncbi:MAG: hypothetical protein NTX65_10435 [Ignavibacteriales bacterium]|nr:hypothetical protein [Ignavibacteriales bacterium]